MKEDETIQEVEEVEIVDQNIEETEQLEELEETAEEIAEEQEFEYVRKTKPIGKLITLVAITAIMLVSSTYAWFSTQKNVTISSLKGEVNVAEGLQMSLDAKHWLNTINFEHFNQPTDGSGWTVKADSPTTYLDEGATFQEPAEGITNIVPTDYKPVSTTGRTNEGIGKTSLTMYNGIYTDTEGLKSIGVAPEEASSGYYAFDLYLLNTSAEEKTKDILKLDANSVVIGNNSVAGIQNTVRVGIALYENNNAQAGFNAATAAAGTNMAIDGANPLTAEQIIAGTSTGKNISDVTIWEPNANAHVQQIINSTANTIKFSEADRTKYTYLGTSYNALTGISRFADGQVLPTYGLTADSAAEPSTIQDVYDWATPGRGLKKQYTLQTNANETRTEVIDLLSIKKLEANENATDKSFEIVANQYQKVRVYVWIEGQDPDCITYASLGGGLELTLGLTKGDDANAEIGESDITEIELDTTEEELEVGGTFTLTATINEDAEDEVIWISSNTSVATVVGNPEIALLRENYIKSSVKIASLEENVGNLLMVASTGKTKTATITAIGPGTATITAKNSTGSVSHSCTVTVLGEEDDNENVDPPAVAGGPYLPSGFSWANAGHTEIADPLNNQYVWISVPRDATVYNDLEDDTEDTAMSDTTNEDILAFDVNNLTTANLTAIEKELHEYTATYRNGTDFKDEFYSTDQHGFADATAYNNHKNAMLTSVFKNEGFYVGKYETGIADTDPENIDTNHEARTAVGAATQTPVIQANAYPYNWVTNKQAQELANTKFNGGGYTTSLMFGVQWDLVLKHLEVTNAATVDELNSDSREWGNYYNNTTYSTDAKGKYYVSSWTDGAYNKTTSEGVLLSTGASSEFGIGGIYDLAGNVYEWTLEYTSDTYTPCAYRGGFYIGNGDTYPASYRYYSGTTNPYRSFGFRVALF